MVKLKTKRERQDFIRMNWRKDATWEDVQDLSNMFGIKVSTIHNDLKEMGLTYLTKTDIARIKRENYLKNVWAKQPRESRDSVRKVASILNSSESIITEDIKRLGLEDKKLSSTEVVSNQKTAERRGRESDYKKYWDRYRKMGVKVTYVDIALDTGIELGRVRSEIERLNITEMIKPLTPNPEYATFELRMAYYDKNREYFKFKPNYLKEAKRLGISPAKIKKELESLCIINAPKSVSVLDDSIDDNVYGKMDYTNNSDYGHSSDAMSYDELNSLLGVGAGTFKADDWGKYGY